MGCACPAREKRSAPSHIPLPPFKVMMGDTSARARRDGLRLPGQGKAQRAASRPPATFQSDDGDPSAWPGKSHGFLPLPSADLARNQTSPAPSAAPKVFNITSRQETIRVGLKACNPSMSRLKPRPMPVPQSQRDRVRLQAPSAPTGRKTAILPSVSITQAGASPKSWEGAAQGTKKRATSGLGRRASQSKPRALAPISPKPARRRKGYPCPSAACTLSRVGATMGGVLTVCMALLMSFKPEPVSKTTMRSSG